MNSRILMVIVFSLITFSIALFTAKIYSKGLHASTHESRNILITTLFVPLAFIASLIAFRTVEWGIGPILYTLINTIAGVFFYIFLGALVLAAILIIGLIAKVVIPVWVSVALLVASVLLAGIGIVQSRFIRVTDYTVTLTEAPESWNGKTAVLVSDTHFGLVNYKRFSDKVVNRILAIKPDFVLHAGDFYDGPKISTAPLTASWQKFTAQIPVFYAPGNHEIYGDYAGFIKSISDAGITVLDDKKAMYDGVQIAGITYHGGAVSPEATDEIAKLAIDPSKPAILINHPPTSLEAAEHAGISLMVSGHTHNGQFWPLTYIVRKIYGVYYYGHHTYKSMDQITTSGVGTWGPAIRLFNTPELVKITFKTK